MAAEWGLISFFLCVQHMIAGAVAGMGEHLAMFPVDTVKTRMQALGHPGQQVSVQRASMYLCGHTLLTATPFRSFTTPWCGP